MSSLVIKQDVKIAHLEGAVECKLPNGKIIVLHVGDTVPAGSVLTIPPNAIINFDDSSVSAPVNSTNGVNDQSHLSGQLVQNPTDTETPNDIAQLQQQILSGQDPTKLFEAAAAGETIDAGSSIGSSNEGSTSISRTNSATISTAGYDTTGVSSSDSTTDIPTTTTTVATTNQSLITLPTITVDAPALTNDSTPTITGTTDLPANSSVTLVVTDSAGVQQTITATVNTDGTYSVDVPNALAEGNYSVMATATDAAGNSSQANDSGSVDTIFGDGTNESATYKPTVTIEDDVNDDHVINASELATHGAGVQVSVAVNHTELQAGGSVSLSISNGTSTGTVTLSLLNGALVLVNGDSTTSVQTAYSYSNGTISFTETVAEGVSLTVAATQTDKEGNVSQKGTDTAIVNHAPTLDLDANNSHNTVVKQSISGLFNTGVDANNTKLAVGVSDPHYVVVSTPTGSTLTDSVATHTNWTSADSNTASPSAWIGNTGSQSTGEYQYSTTFTLQAGADLKSAVIDFDLSADNYLKDILVNDVSTGISYVLNDGRTYTSLTHIQLTGATANFLSGNNTITFVVENRDPGSPSTSGPSGIRIDNIVGTVDVIVSDNVNHLADYTSIYVEGNPVTIVDSDIQISDQDGDLITGATVRLTNAQSNDLLIAEGLPSGITVTVSGNVVTLSGSASASVYEQALQMIKFSNSSDTPDTTVDRIVEVTVTDGANNSNTASSTIRVVTVDDAPRFDPDANNSHGDKFSTNYTENGSGIAIVDTVDAVISDDDSKYLYSATIQITNIQSGDVLSVSNLPGGLQVSIYDPVKGVLILSGKASLADYEAALKLIKFSSTSENPSEVQRDITITVNDGHSNSAVSHSYVNVTATNDAPTSSDTTVSIKEDLNNTNAVYTFNVSDFGNYHDNDAGSSPSIIITSLPTNGTLYLDGQAISATNTTITLAKISAGELTFDPINNSDADSSISFKVSDGISTNDTTYTTTIAITPVADTPTLSAVVSHYSANSVLTDHTYSLDVSAAVTDTDGSENISKIIISGLPNGTTLSAGMQNSTTGEWTLTKAQLSGLTFTTLDTVTDSFSFKVKAVSQEGGDTANTASTEITINVLSAHTSLLSSVAGAGLSGEYYGYNDSPSLNSNSYNTQYGDGTYGKVNDTNNDNNNFANISDINDAIGIINSKRGLTVSTDVTSSVTDPTSASDSATDAKFVATTFNYGNGVTNNLGNNPSISTAGSSIASGSLKTFLGSTDSATLRTTSSFGNTTDAVIRMLGQVYFAAGTYDFSITADDGYIVYIDGVRVVYYDRNTSATTTQSVAAGIPLTEGLHNIEIVYWDQTGSASFDMNYKLHSSTTWLDFNSTNLLMLQEGASLSEIQDVIKDSSGNYVIRTGADFTGTSANDYVAGTDGKDHIHGGDGNDVISGGSGNDILEGGAGADTIYGGAGNDILTGGTGIDTFKWASADKGTTTTVATDHVTDFDKSTDFLDIKDLLTSVNSTNSAATTDVLKNYLSTSITSDGHLSIDIHNAASSSSTVLNHIVLDNVSVSTQTAADQYLTDLIANNHLVIK